MMNKRSVRIRSAIIVLVVVIITIWLSSAPAAVAPIGQAQPAQPSPPPTTGAPYPAPIPPISPSPAPSATPANPTLLPTFTIPSPLPITPSLPAPSPLPATIGPSTNQATPAPVARSRPLEYGAVAHLFYLDRNQPLRLAREAGFGWIRQQIHWKDIEGPPGVYSWSEVDGIVADLQRYGFRVLISVVRAPAFYSASGFGLPQETKPLGNFMEALASRYRGRIHAIEVWNEQNLAHENGGWVQVEYANHYVELLRESYTRIKAVAPDIQVIAGGPASTGITNPTQAVADLAYYQAMYRYNNGIIRQYMDGQAVHPGGAANPPDTLWPDQPSQAKGWNEHPTFYFRHIENIRALMVEQGMADIPIWITEFGWATANTSPGYEFGNQVSLEQQASYISRAMQLTAERYPWVATMFIWNLNFAPLWAQQGQPAHEQAAFGILGPDYQPRPAYYAAQRVMLGR